MNDKIKTSKISRLRINEFIKDYSTNDLVLEIGAKTEDYGNFFPNSIRLNLKKYPGISVLADAQALPFKTCSFSTILCTEVLEHCQDPQKVIDEIFRVLQPGGTLILTTRFTFPIHDAPDDYFRFTKYGLRLLTKRFSSCTIQEESNAFSTIAILLQRVLLQCEFRSAQRFWTFFLRSLIFIFLKFENIIHLEYGDNLKTYTDGVCMPSGYYLILKK
ncbi:MAG TPA: class I SAM-dependent methyltransferase [Candidatus Omnitrophota bacterium]|nr:class I SAM-dependent methyltransferase [Candidatus Omnitrophota bacterium]HSA31291.1 class I SAM-dependent methyltransferase [Candidatus Omnitrophota bacterium]